MMLSKLSGIVVPILIIGFGISEEAIAQITPDQTLPKNTIVTPNNNRLQIDGGTSNGVNLFHSFQDFSVPEGITAFFNNNIEIQNIISRVTGNNLSNIQGILQANGNANLFLINPNGIIFGPKAQLNIGGSFVASTAGRILFPDGNEFSATNPQAPPLLTINVPIGLQLGSNAGTIINQSQAIGIGLDGNNTPTGLQVQPNQNITLVGGNLEFQNGYLTAYNGKIELAAFQNGIWYLGSNFSASPNSPNLQLGSIFSRNSEINTSGVGGGLIAIQGGNVIITDGSRLLANTLDALNGGGITINAQQLRLQNRAFISSSTIGKGNAGDINITAQNSIELIGTEPLAVVGQLIRETFNPTQLADGIFSVSLGEGSAGNITLISPQLQVNNGGAILTPALGIGAGGNINIFASGSAAITQGSVLVTGTNNIGNAGDILINTPQLRLIEDGNIITSPGRSGEGEGGDITINAEIVELRGVSPNSPSPGGLLSLTLGSGDAGDITINADQLLVAEGSQISASAAGAGKGGNLTVNANSVLLRGTSPDGLYLSGLLTSSSLLTVQGQKGEAPAGDLTVNTQQLTVEGGAQISAATGSEGSAGNLRLNASESIEVRGFGTNVARQVEAVSFGVVGDGIVPSAIESNTSGAGRAGDLQIRTGRLIVRDGAEIGVRGINEGAAGNLEIQAGEILLDNDGTLSAATVAGTGGNIRVLSDRIELRGGSQITTNAGNADGGNITLSTSNLVALENSDITANAQQGKGGQVQINAQGIFGTQFREFLTPDSDITATSELGPEFSGAVEISSPEVDPSAGLVELPTNVVDPTTLIAARCRRNDENEFVVTGRGGLPASPLDTLSAEPTIANWIEAIEQSPVISHQSVETRHGASVPSYQSVETRHGASVPSYELRQSAIGNSDTQPVTPDTLIEAQGWIVRADGVIELIANPPQYSHSSPVINNQCSVISNQ